MASATVEVRQVEKIVDESFYVLYLTKEEAQALRDLLYFGVAGSPSGSRRGVTDRISEALSFTDIRPTPDEKSDIDGFVTFLDGGPKRRKS